MFRRRSEEIIYRRMPKTSGCPFCNLTDQTLNPRPRQTLQKTVHSIVVTNSFPYDFWDLSDVSEHLLLLPKRHISSMADLTANERKDMIDLMCDYEQKGYSVYTRAPQNITRTFPHIHTHLFKHHGNSKKAQFVLSVRKPYFLIKF